MFRKTVERMLIMFELSIQHSQVVALLSVVLNDAGRVKRVKERKKKERKKEKRQRQRSERNRG